MAIITVTTAADVVDANDGVLSLREAVTRANGSAGFDEIEFAGSLEGATLVLTGGELVVSGDLAIDGEARAGGPEIMLSGGDASRLLNVAGAGTDLALSDMVLRDGYAPSYGDKGGAIYLGGGSLTMNRCTVRNNNGHLHDYDAYGGAIFGADGSRITIFQSSFTNNSIHKAGGGAIAGGDNVTLAIHDSQFVANSGYFSGGAIDLGGGGSLLVEDSQFVANSSFYTGGAISTGGSLLLEGCVFRDNVGVSVRRAYGGGVALFGGIATITETTFTGHEASDGGAIFGSNSHITISDSTISDNTSAGLYVGGGGVCVVGGSLTVLRTSIAGNSAIIDSGASRGGGIFARHAVLTITDSTIAGNSAIDTSRYASYASGGGIDAGGNGSLTIRNSTITGNRVLGFDAVSGGLYGGGIHVGGRHAGAIPFDIANSIVAGNTVLFEPTSAGFDIFGAITLSNGHNVFGSDVLGNVSSDRENVGPGLLFDAVDPTTGGGLVGADGAVALVDRVTNPALSGGDLLAALSVDQLDAARPRPTLSLPDIGAAESSFAPSTVASANNDVLTGSSSANTIAGLAGHDFIRGLGGNDTLRGNDGGDLLDGGAGNDTLVGGVRFDLALFGGSTAVVVDLSGATDTAKRGSETDTLIGIEGAIGSSQADVLNGDAGRNFFQGGAGKDTCTLGDRRDVVDIDVAGHSRPGAGSRDVVTDFVHLADRLDLSGIDADVTLAGNQAFRFVGAVGLGTTPGTVGIFVDGGNTIVRGSTDTDQRAELQIELAGLVTLTAEDFYL